jgi:DVNP family
MGAPVNSTMSLTGGGRRRNRMTRRKNMRGGQMSTQSVPMMKGGAGKSAVGSKAQVWHGTARHTSGGLTKKDLMKHKGRIISRKKHALGRKALKNLVKAGYKAKKGTFKLFKK